MTLDHFLVLVREEVLRAQRVHPPLNSHHEAYAVLLEEVDEYKSHVWLKEGQRVPEEMERELIQVAAMAARAATDVQSGRQMEHGP